MNDEELQAVLDEIARWREASAVLVDGKRGIRRSAFTPQGRNVHDEVILTAEVWDDEYATTLVFVDGTPRPELVRGIFLDRKRQSHPVD